MRKVGAHGEFVAKSLANRCSGTRMAKVQTTDRRLRFSIVVRFSAASWRELRVIPAVNRPNRPLLGRVRKNVSMEEMLLTVQCRRTNAG